MGGEQCDCREKCSGEFVCASGWGWGGGVPGVIGHHLYAVCGLLVFS